MKTITLAVTALIVAVFGAVLTAAPSEAARADAVTVTAGSGSTECTANGTRFHFLAFNNTSKVQRYVVRFKRSTDATEQSYMRSVRRNQGINDGVAVKGAATVEYIKVFLKDDAGQWTRMVYFRSIFTGYCN